MAALWEPGFTVLDVTDPTRPEFVRWVPGPPNTWTIQVQGASTPEPTGGGAGSDTGHRSPGAADRGHHQLPAARTTTVEGSGRVGHGHRPDVGDRIGVEHLQRELDVPAGDVGGPVPLLAAEGLEQLRCSC